LLVERIGQERVISYAPKQTDYRPNENAAYRPRLDIDDTNDANSRKGDEGATAKASADKGASNPRRESQNCAARLVAEAAGSLEGLNPVWGN
jgi:hypothetical protein